MGKKYYAVKQGRTPGIYMSWADCKKNVSGVSGAVFKGFATIEEAKAYLKGEEKASPEAAASEEKAGNGAIAYVDGSYHPGTKEYSYGAVIFYQGKEERFAEKFSNQERAAMRNVAGEIEGSMCAMKYCLKHRVPELTIYFDYEGIEKWCTGDWKATKEGTIAYRDFYRMAKEKVQIHFVKVKGHSGNAYNDLADALAKQALEPSRR